MEKSSRSAKKSALCVRSKMRSRRRGKNGGGDPRGGRARSSRTAGPHLRRAQTDGAHGSGGGGNGLARRCASGRSRGSHGVVAVPRAGPGPARPRLPVRPTGPLPGIALQAGADGAGRGGSIAPLLMGVDEETSAAARQGKDRQTRPRPPRHRFTPPRKSSRRFALRPPLPLFFLVAPGPRRKSRPRTPARPYTVGGIAGAPCPLPN